MNRVRKGIAREQQRIAGSPFRPAAAGDPRDHDDGTAARAKWRDLYGGEPPGYKRQFLIKRLAYRIQELFYGGLSDAAQTRLQQAAQDDPMARMQRRVSGNPRSQVDILPGTRFVRIWKDCRYEVLAHENGFEHEGRMFRSLSAVAREITGTRWNGKLFFGLKKGKRGGRHA